MDGERSVWPAIHHLRGLSFKFGQKLSQDKLISLPKSHISNNYRWHQVFSLCLSLGKGKKTKTNNKTTTDNKTNNKPQTTTTKKIQTKTQPRRENRGKKKTKIKSCNIKNQPQHRVGMNHMFACGAGGWKSSHEGVKRRSKSISPCYAANLPGSRGTGWFWHTICSANAPTTQRARLHIHLGCRASRPERGIQQTSPFPAFLSPARREGCAGGWQGCPQALPPSPALAASPAASSALPSPDAASPSHWEWDGFSIARGWENFGRAVNGLSRKM